MKVLIVVDMLNDFIDDDGVLSLGQTGIDIVNPIAEKLDLARKNKDLVIYLCDNHETDDKEFDRFPAHAVKDTWGSEIITELYPHEDDFVVEKQRYSGFFDTDLEQIMSDFIDPEEVEVVGCCTSICVAGTIEELVNRDYKVVVDRKAVADFNQEAHEFFLNYQLPNIFGVEVR